MAGDLNARRRVLAVIPARRGSTRLPGKPLLELEGLPMVVRVARRVTLAEVFSSVWVATDDLEIADVVKAHGFEAVLTSAFPRSGTERVAEALGRRDDFDLVVNVQGDEPLIDPLDLRELVRRDEGVGLHTLARPEAAFYPLSDDPAHVWVQVHDDGRAVDFWRGRRPDLDRRARVHAHVGVYACHPEWLRRLVALPEGIRERSERLEQLRALENKVPIQVTMCQSEHPSVGVDTAADAERVRAWLRAHPE